MPDYAPGIVRAIDRGFWPRLMGYLSAVSIPNPGRVVELASTGWTKVVLSLSEAATLVNLGREARTAAKSWFAGVPIRNLVPPVVPLAASPAAGGGEPGPYEVGLVVQPTASGIDTSLSNTIVTFSSDCRGSVEDCLDALMAFRDSIGSDTPGLAQFIDSLVDNWLKGRRDTLLPLWLIERLD